MKKVREPKSRYIVVEHLRKFFPDLSKNIITREEAYSAWGREASQNERNDHWLSNKLVDLRKYGFIQSVASKKDGKTLVGIRITDSGLEALGRNGKVEEKMTTVNIHATEPIANKVASILSDEKISWANARTMIARLKEQNPDFEITFDVKWKE